MLFSQRLGTGQDGVVLLHGFMGSGRNLRSLAQRWSELDPSLFFLLPDLTGHGRSPPLPQGADLSTLARDVLETARAEGIEGKLRIVGHSLGGRVGLQMILDTPEEVGELTILDVSPGPIDPAQVDTGQVLEIYRGAPATAESREEMRAYFHSRNLSPGLTEWLLTSLERENGRYRWSVDREALAAFHERTHSADLWAALEGEAEIRCIRGGDSPYLSRVDAQRMEALGRPVETVEGAGHYLNATHPMEVARLLVKLR